MSKIQLKPIETREEWDIAAHFHNLYWPYEPLTGKQLFHWADEHPKDVIMRRWLVLEDGAPAGYARMAQTYWLADKSDSMISAEVDPASPFAWVTWTKALDLVEGAVLDSGLTKGQYWMADIYPFPNEELHRRGYQKGQTNPVTRVDVGAFDPSPFAEAEARVREAGYEIMSFAEFRERNPDSWLQPYYDWEMAVMADVPLQGEFEALPIETFEKMTNSPTVNPHTILLAEKDGFVASSTQIHPNQSNPSIASTGLTGTRRGHRRMGLAAALKSLALQECHRRGIEFVYTDNEENNPMYQLNIALGFHKVCEVSCFSKTFVISE